jgi:CheY-like chemotaxis protein
MATKHHIILVDDDQNIRRFLDEFLKLKGFKVSSFSSAEDALPEINKGDFSIAIFDIVLPGISGREACAKIRENSTTANRPIILMTAIHRGTDQAQKAKEEYGATEYLLKPFSLDTLYQKVLELLGEEYRVSDIKERETATIQGTLTETGFPKLLHDLYALKATGLLHVTLNERKKVVYFVEGYPIFVRSNLIRECLGKLLVRKGIIDERECEESLKRVKETGRLQGTVLIEMGYLTPQQLHDVLKLQASEKLLEIFSWQNGEYRFNHAQDFKKNITRINLSPATLILQGLRKFYSEETLDKVLEPHLNYYPALSTNPHYRFQDIDLTAKDASLLAECRGDKTFEEILEKYPLSRFENKQLLTALVTVKMLESREMPLSPDEQSTLFTASPEKQEKRESFLNDYTRMMQQDFFVLLGVELHVEGFQLAPVSCSQLFQHPSSLGHGLAGGGELSGGR